MPECYIRGSTIKYLRISDEVIENYKEDTSNRGGSGNMGRRDGGRGGGRGGSSQRGGGNAGRPGGQQRGGGSGGGQFNQANRRPANNLSGSNLGGGARPPKQQRK
jgi:U6 snRNA-associated Sm-like protein LSm4